MKIAKLALLVLGCTSTFSQVGINTETPDPSSALDIVSTDKGILIPRMTTAQRTAIASPATGLMVYDTTLRGFYGFDGTTWNQGVFSSGAWSLIGNAGTDPNVNFLGTTDNHPIVFKTNNAEAMVITNTGAVSIQGRDVGAPRLAVTRPIAGRSFPAIAAIVENNDGAAYPNNVIVSNAGNTGRVRGNYSFAPNAAGGNTGNSVAGISYVDVSGVNNDLTGLSFYVGTPTSQGDTTKDKLVIGTNGNIYIGYESSITTYPTSKLNVANGDVYLSSVDSGIVMKSPDGNCWKTTITSAGILQTLSITCP